MEQAAWTMGWACNVADTLDGMDGVCMWWWLDLHVEMQLGTTDVATWQYGMCAYVRWAVHW